MRKLKLLVVATMALGVISATTAASAFAEYHIASASGGLISGIQTSQNALSTSVGTLKCSGVSFSGSQSTETASTLTLHPSYSGCTLAGLSATVSTSSCSYIFEKPVTSPAPVHASMTMGCAGGEILIHDSLGLNCSISVGGLSRPLLHQVSFTNNAGGTVTVTFELTGISYRYSGSCPSAKGVEGGSSNGTYSGQALLSSFSEIMVT
ncbi:MAG TPA: hypothetical protein VGI73_13680 [Solirubrobacterales bacterium]